MSDALDFAVRKKHKLKEPRDYNVILLNDDWTPMDFVVQILMLVFHKNELDAERIMLDVHNKGKGIAGVYPFDIARSKADEVKNLAEGQNFPLECTIEAV